MKEESKSQSLHIEDHVITYLDNMDESQLSNYQEMLTDLGNFADKVLINTLSMIAEDYSTDYPETASHIYNSIRTLLLSKDMKPDCKLPLVYVIDSILKNAKGDYIQLMQDDIHQWMETVYSMLENDDVARGKLRKVWNTWKDCNIFPIPKWSRMGKCFLEEDSKLRNAKLIADAKAKAAGIERAPDGTLKLSSGLRKKMQMVLDDIQGGSDVEELDKVSLERLADINPDLLVQIKKAAEELNNGQDTITDSDRQYSLKGSQHGLESRHSSNSSVFMELRSPQEIQRCAEWEKLNLNYMEVTHDSTAKLQQYIRNGTSSTSFHGGSKNIDITKLLGTASATAEHLTLMLGKLKAQSETKHTTVAFGGGMYGQLKSISNRSSKNVDRSKFTTQGVKERNESVVSRLYEVGLPFVSSSDGRRFATQSELTKHLDELFRIGLLEKSMERTEERGWYPSENRWMGVVSTEKDDYALQGDGDGEYMDESDNLPSTVTADETRDRCAICGINFTMHFDQDEGEWKYTNCREIEMLNDDVAENESEDVLVHISCLRGLGSPQYLTVDQVLLHR